MRREPSFGSGPWSSSLRILNGNENAPVNLSWLRHSEKPLATTPSRSGLTIQSGKRVNATLPASCGRSGRWTAAIS